MGAGSHPDDDVGGGLGGEEGAMELSSGNRMGAGDSCSTCITTVLRGLDSGVMDVG